MGVVLGRCATERLRFPSRIFFDSWKSPSLIGSFRQPWEGCGMTRVWLWVSGLTLMGRLDPKQVPTECDGQLRQPDSRHGLSHRSPTVGPRIGRNRYPEAISLSRPQARPRQGPLVPRRDDRPDPKGSGWMGGGFPSLFEAGGIRHGSWVIPVPVAFACC